MLSININDQPRCDSIIYRARTIFLSSISSSTNDIRTIDRLIQLAVGNTQKTQFMHCTLENISQSAVGVQGVGAAFVLPQ